MTNSFRFELIDLKLFELTAQQGSISAAAEKMPLALSAASMRIKLLEERLGLELFLRKPRGVELTHAGKLFLDYSRRMLNAAQDAQQGMDALSGKSRVKLRVFSNTTGLSTELPIQLATFLRDNPSIDMDLVQKSSKEVLQALYRGEADLGIVDGDYDRRDLLYFLYQSHQLVIITHPQHQLAKNATVKFDRLLDFPLVGYQADSSLQQFIQRMSLIHHRSGNYRATAPDFNSVAQLVSKALGVAILPLSLARQYQFKHSLSIVELDETWANRELYICCRSETSTKLPAIRLAQFLTEQLDKASHQNIG